MRRAITYPFFGLCLFLFCWVNLPKTISDVLRENTVRPLGYFSKRPYEISGELEKLQLENQTLRRQIEHICGWLTSDQHLHEQLEIYQKVAQRQKKGGDESVRSFFERKAEHLRQLLLNELYAIPAQVIYRDPSSWSSSLWVSVGEEDNQKLGYPVIAKNSPVVSGGALVGVVDYMGKKQSRVRLITDSGLSPAVRAVRQKSELEELYLAKGEIQGSSAPFWRSRGTVLKGIGFHCDYPESERLAHELKGSYALPALLQEGDGLETSGLDGVFPAGLKVGTISWIAPLKEGGYAYEIEARPSASHLNDLQTVFILPPLAE